MHSRQAQGSRYIDTGATSYLNQSYTLLSLILRQLVMLLETTGCCRTDILAALTWWIVTVSLMKISSVRPRSLLFVSVAQAGPQLFSDVHLLPLLKLTCILL